jgi:hypothetical protein
MQLCRTPFDKTRAVRSKTSLNKIVTLIFGLNFVVFTLITKQVSSKLHKLLLKKVKKLSLKTISAKF